VADFFKGLAVGLGIRDSDEQIKFNESLAEYAKGGPNHKATADAVREVVTLSADLKARTLEAFRDGYMQSYSDHEVAAGASATYQVSDRAIRLAPKPADRIDHIETMFMLGHETEHARSLRGVNYAATFTLPAIERLANGPSVGPRDYTPIIEDYVERTRREEGRAHIGGFNAVASFEIAANNPKPRDLLRTLYEAHPDRMGDFITKHSDQMPATYTLKAGLTLGDDGLMPYSSSNIDAMKTYYADKAQLGAAHMNYRQDSIEFVRDLVVNTEVDLAKSSGQTRDYVIDPVRLQAHPALGLPADGMHRTDVLPNIEDLGIVLNEPLIVQPAPVRLTPDDGDHPLFAQALTKVVEYHNGDSLTEVPQDLRNLAASLAVSAHQGGLDRIDQVSLSVDKTGVIATQGDGDLARHVRVEGLEAMATPEGQNLARLPVVAPVALEQPPAQQGQIVAEVSGVAPLKI